MIDGMKADPNAMVTTPGLRCDYEAYNSFVEDRLAGRVGGTTVVFSNSHNALYFSKEVIPYTGKKYVANEEVPVFHHVGLYAYRPEALEKYMGFNAGPLEELEGLEQLRFLENDIPIRVVEVDAAGRVFWELNNPIDVERVESALIRMGIA